VSQKGFVADNASDAAYHARLTVAGNLQIVEDIRRDYKAIRGALALTPALALAPLRSPRFNYVVERDALAAIRRSIGGEAAGYVRVELPNRLLFADVVQRKHLAKDADIFTSGPAALLKSCKSLGLARPLRDQKRNEGRRRCRRRLERHRR
jgi:hypothetical protein